MFNVHWIPWMTRETTTSKHLKRDCILHPREQDIRKYAEEEKKKFFFLSSLRGEKLERNWILKYNFWNFTTYDKNRRKIIVGERGKNPSQNFSPPQLKSNPWKVGGFRVAVECRLVPVDKRSWQRDIKGSTAGLQRRENGLLEQMCPNGNRRERKRFASLINRCWTHDCPFVNTPPRVIVPIVALLCPHKLRDLFPPSLLCLSELETAVSGFANRRRLERSNDTRSPSCSFLFFFFFSFSSSSSLRVFLLNTRLLLPDLSSLPYLLG